MANFLKARLSENILGEPIHITTNSSPGTLVHDLVDGYTSLDEVWLYASNTTASSVIVTVELGGAGLKHEVKETVDGNKTALVIPGLPMHGNGKISVYAGTANVINVYGWVNEIVV